VINPIFNKKEHWTDENYDRKKIVNSLLENSSNVLDDLAYNKFLKKSGYSNEGYK